MGSRSQDLDIRIATRNAIGLPSTKIIKEFKSHGYYAFFNERFEYLSFNNSPKLTPCHRVREGQIVLRAVPHHASAISGLDKEIANLDSDTDMEGDSASDLDELSESPVETKEIQNTVPLPQIPLYNSTVTPPTSNQLSASHNQPCAPGVPTLMRRAADLEGLKASTASMKVLFNTISDANVDEEIKISVKAALCKCILAL